MDFEDFMIDFDMLEKVIRNEYDGIEVNRGIDNLGHEEYLTLSYFDENSQWSKQFATIYKHGALKMLNGSINVLAEINDEENFDESKYNKYDKYRFLMAYIEDCICDDIDDCKRYLKNVKKALKSYLNRNKKWIR